MENQTNSVDRQSKAAVTNDQLPKDKECSKPKRADGLRKRIRRLFKKEDPNIYPVF